MQKRLFKFTVFAVMAVIAVILFSFKQGRIAQDESRELSLLQGNLKLPWSHKEPLDKKSPPTHDSISPDDYRMAVLSPVDRPKAQADWDKLLSKFAGKKSAQTNNKQSIQEARNRIQDIDEMIKNYQEILAKDPNNQNAQQGLMSMMVLRSIAARELPDVPLSQ